MHEIEPYYGWDHLYRSSDDQLNPFYGKEYNYDLYSEAIYGYFIAPGWDFFGSETLYVKVLFVDYTEGYTIMEFIGEWNDAINNDIMHFKRNIIEHLMLQDVTKFILIGENVLNFHGSDDCYYEEWFEEMDDQRGWAAALNFRDFVMEEWCKFNVDSFLNFGGTLILPQWRTMEPQLLYKKVKQLIERRIALI